MPRIKINEMAERKEAATWQQTIIDRIRAGKVVPIISQVVDYNLVLGGHTPLVEAYADYVQYPLADKHNLPQTAQFKGVTDESISDAWALKTDYINFIKNRLFDLAEANDVSEESLAEVEEAFDDVTFSEFSERLGYPRFDKGQA
ncbi:MAG TPA: hypothetical protein VEC96_13940, partial [Anaerolineae bacterium]|nr:hypothetical protein [Anaerolineae bacterium]